MSISNINLYFHNLDCNNAEIESYSLKIFEIKLEIFYTIEEKYLP